MRNVIIKEWVPVSFNEGNRIPKTGCYSDEYTIKGNFHEWGIAYEEFDKGIGNYTVAIVELENGEIAEILPYNVKFLK